MGFMPGMPPQAAMPPVQPIIEPPSSIAIEDEPPSKKARGEDNLVAEAEFLAAHQVTSTLELTHLDPVTTHYIIEFSFQGPVTIQVQVPSGVDKPEWRLNGQVIGINLVLTDTVATLKSKLQEETGLPPAKQKISYDGMFFKDNNSIAFYNLLNGTTVHLQIKERGGRKK